jgi:hypothetical protein
MITTRTTLTAAVATAIGLGLVLAPSASASGGTAVRASGSCSAGATWHLKGKHDNGRIEVEGEVDANHAGQSWHWSISDNGTVVRSGSATTTARSGSFSVNRRIGNRAGTDHVVFRATRPATGQNCQGAVDV